MKKRTREAVHVAATHAATDAVKRLMADLPTRARPANNAPRKPPEPKSKPAPKPEIERKKPAKITDTHLEYARRRAPRRTAVVLDGVNGSSRFTLPQPPPGTFPAGATGMAMDSAITELNTWGMATPYAGAYANGLGFLGYVYLAELAQIPEYRRISERLATEMTRKWIKLQSVGEDEDKSGGPVDENAPTLSKMLDEAAMAKGLDPGAKRAARIKGINDDMDRLQVRKSFKTMAEQDGFFGRAHLFMDFGTEDPAELKTPIGDGRDAVSRGKVARGSLKRVAPVEAVWCYPTAYNSNNPLRADWYNPQMWFVQGQEVHVSRLMKFVGREVPDVLKPSYAFGGLSMSQMAKPYVDNWLQTRQSVSNLISNFSTRGLKTNLQSYIEIGGDQAQARLDLFNLYSDNQGLMVLDNGTEEYFEVTTPLGTLDALQAQSQEHMGAVSGIPLVVLLGLQPKGLNASSEGDLRIFYDFVKAYQEDFFRVNLTRVIDFIQLSLYGDIDPHITFDFVDLWSLDAKQMGEVRKSDSETDKNYIESGVLHPEEVRQRLADDADSPYASIDVSDVPETPEAPDMGGGDPGGGDGDSPGTDPSDGPSQREAASDARRPFVSSDEFKEGDHPRAQNGQFGSGGGTAKPSQPKDEKNGSPLAAEWAQRSKDAGLTSTFYPPDQKKWHSPGGGWLRDPAKMTKKQFESLPIVYHGTKPGYEADGLLFVTRSKSGAEFHGAVKSFRILPGAEIHADTEERMDRNGNETLMAAKEDSSTGIIHRADLVDAAFPKSKQAQDEAPFEESKHPRAPDGKFGSGGGSSAGTKTVKTESSAAAKPKALNVSKMTKVMNKKGSNPGGVYQDKGGKEYYVKELKSAAHVTNEIVAADLYKLAGSNTLNYVPVEGGKHVATEYGPLDAKNVGNLTASEKKQAQSDFVTHAWLGNWDAAGTGGDNIGVKDGKVTVLDTGGALEYRAQGEPKGDKFGDKVTEIDTMLDPGKNQDTAKLFAGMGPEQMKASAEKVTSLTDASIIDAVAAAGGAPALAAKLIKRKAQIGKLFGLPVDGDPDFESKHKRGPGGKFAKGPEKAETIEPITAPKPEEPGKAKKTAFGGLYKTGATPKDAHENTVKHVLSKPANKGSSYRQMLAHLIKESATHGTGDKVPALKSLLAQANVGAANELFENAKGKPAHSPEFQKMQADAGKYMAKAEELGWKGAGGSAAPAPQKPAEAPAKPAAPSKPPVPASAPAAKSGPAAGISAKIEEQMAKNAVGKQFIESDFITGNDKIKAAVQVGASLQDVEKMMTPGEKWKVANKYGSIEKAFNKGQQYHKADLASKAAQAEIEAKITDPEIKKHYDAIKGIAGSQQTNQYIAHARAKLKSAGLEGKVTAEEAAPIVAYSGSHYRPLNQQLRTGSVTKEQWAMSKALNAVLDKLPAVPGVTLRGTDLTAQQVAMYQPGMVIEERGFTSTGKGSKFSGNTTFEIHGHSGRDISKLSIYPSESEVLFKSGSRFEVVSRTGDKIVLKEVSYAH